MQVYLIRHGIAQERDEHIEDSDRALTEKGEEKTVKVGHRLEQLDLRFQVILTSPLVRARQTAEILVKTGLSEKLQEFPPLAPNGNIQEWLQWYQQCEYLNLQANIALVGHQPDLTNWAEMMVWGSVKEQIVLKKSGVIGIELPETGEILGQGHLFLLTSPKWIF